jgi:hypothetical protein
MSSPARPLPLDTIPAVRSKRRNEAPQIEEIRMSISDDDITSTNGPAGEGVADGGANPNGHDGGADGSAGEGVADGGANQGGHDSGADGSAGEGTADGGANSGEQDGGADGSA